MNEPLRILVRLLGVVLFLASIAGVLLIVTVGPDEVGQAMGETCKKGTNKHNDAEHCTWQDALGIMQALPWICLVGAVLMFTMRRDWVGRDRKDDPAPGGPVALASTGGSRLQLFGVLSVMLIVVVNFVGVFVYRASYTVVTTKQTYDKIRRETSKPDFSDRAASKAPAAPKGLARGSLLRTDGFRKAMAEIRRAAPAGARLARLRVASGRIDAEVLAGGKVVALMKPWDGKVIVESKARATDGDEPLVTFAQLDAPAPQRVASAAARPREIDYLVLFDAVGLRWNAFLAEGKGQFSVSPDGREVL
jgi:hypothetical protein